MRILSFKRNHDGTYALLSNGKLIFSIEAEKGSRPRYDHLRTYHVFEALEKSGDIDVLVVSGWNNKLEKNRWDAGYFGFGPTPIVNSVNLLGKKIKTFSSSHERSHIIGGVAMSELEQGTEFYALVWEGNIGSFYHVSSDLVINKIGDPMTAPGAKYEFLYHLMDPKQTRTSESFNAGKLMALSSFGDSSEVSCKLRQCLKTIISEVNFNGALKKDDPRLSELYNIGFDRQISRNVAKLLSEKIFNKFYSFAEKNLNPGLPLIITGGCGLNCNWNSYWTQSGIFDSVFVPPVCNDSGSAIGSAADAQLYFTKNVKIDWDVFRGEEFKYDESWINDFERVSLDFSYLVTYMKSGGVLPWVQGRYEIGPRALGHRSLLAEPFSRETHRHLNSIKSREDYRPIAPICLSGEEEKHFDILVDHRHMLYTVQVKNKKLEAITHVDNSARLQTIDSCDCTNTARLLEKFGENTGVSVLCNTSLNFNGKGFINKMSDLVHFSRKHSIQMFVVDTHIYRRRP